MSTIQGNLASLCRDLESAQKKAEKIKGGKPWANKNANATSDLNYALQQWEAQAPFVFEQLQALDENRVNHLRDALTQFTTHELDQVEKSRIAAESSLNALLIVDTTDEISTFVARISEGGPSIAPGYRSRTTTGSTLSAPAPVVISHDDGASGISSVSAGALRYGLSPGSFWSVPNLGG